MYKNQNNFKEVGKIPVYSGISNPNIQISCFPAQIFISAVFPSKYLNQLFSRQNYHDQSADFSRQ